VFLPLGTTRPRLRTPWVTYSLMGVNTLVLLLQMASPIEFTRSLCFVPADPSPIAWFTSIFAHAGLMHLGGNLLFLWLFGTVAEDVLGPLLFLAFYFGGAIGATLLDWLVSAAFVPADLMMPRLGASGAIAGIMGLSAVCFMRTKVRVLYFFMIMFLPRYGIWEAPIAVFGGLWVVWEFLLGSATTTAAAAMQTPIGGVAHWAHVGGFAAGMIAALLLHLRSRVAREDLLTGRAGIEDTSGFFSQAGELERVVAQTPGDAESWYALGQAQELQGRLERAAAAYENALTLSLRQRDFPRAAAAYASMKEYAKPDSLPPAILFDLACALEETGHAFEAYDIFLLAAKTHAGQALAETSLIRAGELARKGLGEPEKAASAFRRLLEEYPFSNWVGLAQDGLRSLGLPEKAPAPPQTKSYRLHDVDLRDLHQPEE